MKGRVLFVEDDVNLLEGVKTVLELDGYLVTTAENGEQALAALRAASKQGDGAMPELIVSDIMMPKMDGIQLLREVRKEPAWLGIPFIFLTARSEKMDVQRGKQLGVDDYLIKPFDAEDLLIAVDSRMNRQRALNRRYEGEVSDVKRRILTILNHEFRTPLTFVVAYADMLNQPSGERLSNDEMLTFLKGVSTGAVRLRRLIENFIALVEIETGEAKRNFQVRKAIISDLTPIFEQTCASILGDSASRCLIKVQPGIPAFVADVGYLQQALGQLLDNALKFSKQDGTIEFGARGVGDEVHLWVRDRGRGIPPQELEHIWQSFYQVNRSTYEDQGAGAGLAIVRGVAELHGGRVAVQSRPGEGSIFEIILPVLGHKMSMKTLSTSTAS